MVSSGVAAAADRASHMRAWIAHPDAMGPRAVPCWGQTLQGPRMEILPSVVSHWAHLAEKVRPVSPPGHHPSLALR